MEQFFSLIFKVTMYITATILGMGLSAIVLMLIVNALIYIAEKTK